MLRRDERARPRIMVLGLRGFPDVQGGVERHAEQVYPLVVCLGCEVEAVVRSPYTRHGRGSSWQGVTYRRIWSPRVKGFEALVHTFLGVLYAAWQRPDLVHIHAIGPAVWTPLARVLGLRVVVTHHGPDYERQRWGPLARGLLKLGEQLGMRYANACIAVSETTRRGVRERCGRDAARIPNGVRLPQLARSTSALAGFGLEPARYVLNVGRLVPEKRHLDLIEAFSRARLPGWKLVIVGAADHPDGYSRRVERAAAETPGVVLTGFQSGRTLQELYTHAGVFALPSSHEGLPIVMLEALSYGLEVVASDIPANLEVGLDAQRYYALGDAEALALRLREAAASPPDPGRRARTRDWVAQTYDWSEVARATLAVYRSVTALEPEEGHPAAED